MKSLLLVVLVIMAGCVEKNEKINLSIVEETTT